MATKCKNCGSEKVKHYPAEITFGRGVNEPVRVPQHVVATVCLNCGVSQFIVPEPQVAQLQEDNSVPRPHRVQDTLQERRKSA